MNQKLKSNNYGLLKNLQNKITLPYLIANLHLVLKKMRPDFRKSTTLSHLTPEIFMAKTKHFSMQIYSLVCTVLVYMMNYQKSFEILLNLHVCCYGNRVKWLILFILHATKWLIFQNSVTIMLNGSEWCGWSTI